MVLVRPAATVFGLVGLGATKQLLRLPHFGRVELVLQLVAPRAQALFRFAVEGQGAEVLAGPGTTGACGRLIDRTSLVRRPQRRVDSAQLILDAPALANVPFRAFVFDVERALGV